MGVSVRSRSLPTDSELCGEKFKVTILSPDWWITETQETLDQQRHPVAAAAQEPLGDILLVDEREKEAEEPPMWR